MSVNNQTLLVTGAGGHLGRRVVEHLLDAKAGPVIAATRDPGKLADLAAKGALVRKADFDDPASLDAAFRGVDRLLVVSTDALGVPGLRQRQHQAAVDAAVRAGVKHVVYTLMLKPEPGSLIPFAPDHYETEQALMRSGLGWTILRNSWYAENLFLSLPQVLGSGKWYSSAGNGRVAHVARDDAARVAAAVLASASSENARYDVTGATLLTTAQIAEIASEVFGKPIEAVAVTDEQLAAGMTAAGVSALFVPLFVAFDANTRAGGVDVVSGAVETLTCKPPQSLRDFFIANRAVFLQTA